MAKTATQQTSELTGDFMKDIAGRHKLSDNLGAARYWADENGVPMPDRSLSWLRFLSVVGGPLGLDHIYLRSPVTGFIKLITFGGFGLWWLWDTLQVFLEKERVIKYGLTAPFDIPMKILTGVGQGMITDQPSGYKSKASFPFYILATLLGFTGLDSLVAGKFGLAIRRFVDFGYFGGLVTGGAFKGGSVIAYFFAAIAGFFVLVPYFTNLWGLVTGYANDVTYTGLLDWYMQVYDNTGEKVSDSPDAPSKVSAKLQELIGYTPINGETLRNNFAVNDSYKSTEKTVEDQDPKNKGTNNIFSALVWGSPVGVLIYAICSLVGYFLPPPINAFGDVMIMESILNMNAVQAGAVLVKKSAQETLEGVAAAAKETVASATEQAKGVISPALEAAKEQQAAIQAQIASAQQAARNVTNSVKSQVKDVQQAVENTASAVTSQVAAVQQAVGNTASMVKSQVKDVQQAVGNTASAIKQIQTIPVPNLTQSMSRLMKPVANLPTTNEPTAPNLTQTVQTGGGEPLSYEAKILGATVGALIIGGGIKGVIDHLMSA